MKKFYLFPNPVSGTQKGLQISKSVKSILQNSGAIIEESITNHHGHIEELIQKIDLSKYNGILIIGGDGSMHEAVNGLLNRKDKQQIPIGLIPGGSGNAFLHDLKLLDLNENIKAILNGKTKKIDLASLKFDNKSRYSFNIVGWGLVTNIGLTAEKMRRLGTSRYTLASIVEALKYKPLEATVIVDGKDLSKDVVFVMACNTIHSGKGMQIAPKAKLDDGLYDVVVVRGDISKMDIFRLLPKIFDGSHIQHPSVDYYQASSFSILPKNNTTLNIDGELIGKTPIHANVIPQALEIFIN